MVYGLKERIITGDILGVGHEDSDAVRVSVVTGSSEENLRNCLCSLKKTTKDVTLRISVVDNCATFDVASTVLPIFPDAEIIKNDQIKGFGANHNQVLRICDAPYALILNDDIILGERCVDLLVEFLNNHPSVGLVGPAVYPHSWKAQPVTAGFRPSRIPHIIRVCLSDILKELGLLKFLRGSFIRRNIQEISIGNIVHPLILDQITGACCLVRKQVLDQIGLFDEKFFYVLGRPGFYFEGASTRLASIRYPAPRSSILLVVQLVKKLTYGYTTVRDTL